MSMKNRKEAKAKRRAEREAYRPYAPEPTGITVDEVEREVLKENRVWGRACTPMTREVLEQAIVNSRLKYGYTMRGTLDAALASGARPMIGKAPSGEMTLLGWCDALGAVVKV
jgi:hypothetical protein